MIMYCTKQTMERYKLKPPHELSDEVVRAFGVMMFEKEQGDRMLEWGAKLFYFDRRKCLQIMNFASKLTIVLVDVKMDDIEYLGNGLLEQMENLYKDKPDVIKLVHRYFDENRTLCFTPLKDKSAIASLNHMQAFSLCDGYRLGEYISGGILHSKRLNQDLNKIPVTRKVNWKTEYIFPKEEFEKLLRGRYGKGKL